MVKQNVNNSRECSENKRENIPYELHCIALVFCCSIHSFHDYTSFESFFLESSVFSRRKNPLIDKHDEKFVYSGG